MQYNVLGPYLERPRPSRRCRRRHRRWSGRWPPHETFAKLAMVPRWLNCTLDVDWADIGTFVGFWSLVGLRIWGWQRPGVDWYFLVERSESCWDPEMWNKTHWLSLHMFEVRRQNTLSNCQTYAKDTRWRFRGWWRIRLMVWGCRGRFAALLAAACRILGSLTMLLLGNGMLPIEYGGTDRDRG